MGRPTRTGLRRLFRQRFVVNKKAMKRLVIVFLKSGERSSDSANPDVTPRLVGEMVQSTIGAVVATIDYPLGLFSPKFAPNVCKIVVIFVKLFD